MTELFCQAERCNVETGLCSDGPNGLGDGCSGCFWGHAGPPRPAALPGAALPTQAGELTGVEAGIVPQEPQKKNAHLPPAGGVP